MKVLANLYYSKDHEWIRAEGNKVYVGITDYAQESLGALVYVELPEIDDEIKEGDALGVLESVKAASDLYSPISGTVIEVNEDVSDNPDLLNQDAYENWIVCLELSDATQLEDLMSAKEYETFLKEG